MIEVENLVKHYGSARAVEGISFRVQPGEVVGLLGPNGAGKSTTLRVLTGYLPPTSGNVKLADIDIETDPLEGRKRLGYLSESNPLYESLGVWECLDLVARLRGLKSHNLAERVKNVIRDCSLESVISKDVSELSKGYRQRLGLALAILHDPDILVLDEPTSALDPNQQKEVRDLILKLKEKKTVLLSTHILPEAQKICNRLLIIHKGRIVAQGTVDELQGRVRGENVYYVRFMGPPEQISERLASIPQVNRVEHLDVAEPSCPGFRVASPQDPRRDLFEMAAQNHWPIMELRRESVNLEEIFQTLTEDPKEPTEATQEVGG